MNRSISTWKRTGAGKLRRGFTLVELLVVITIIGLLVGLIVPAVFGVQASFNRAAVKFEVQALNDAVENYRSKHGDYPPDGSSWTVMEKHLRKAFPNILQSELNLLNPATLAAQSGSVADIRNDNDTTMSGLVSPVYLRVMDPAEALVFFLGGFSADTQRPFTGPGGPFLKTSVAGQAYEYNGSRQNPFYEFPVARLTLDTVGGVLISTDEGLFGEGSCQGGTGKDLLPVYMSKLNNLVTGSPYVYFDSRTYQTNKTNLSGLTFPYFNFYQPSDMAATATSTRGALGAARPYLSEPSLGYENKQTFQILSPGRDRAYGGRLASSITGSLPSVMLFTSKGNPCTAASPTSFILGSGPPFVLPEFAPEQRMHDNAGNFTESNTLGENIL